MKTYSVILPTAGKSLRFATGVGTTGGTSDTAPISRVKKSFVEIAGKPLWRHSVDIFAAMPCVRQIVIVLAAEDLPFFETEYTDSLQILRSQCEVICTIGGTERVDSVANAMECVSPEHHFVAIHDAARPCISPANIEAVFHAADIHGAAMLATPIVGTIKRSDKPDKICFVAETVPRDGLWEAQTPQVFEQSLLRRAFASARHPSVPTVPTDDAQLVEWLGEPVAIVSGDRYNIKITTPADILFAEWLLYRYTAERQ